ncbi:alpha/beta fold hydrolase [Pseudonocardia pini]|uniref:alpha/beta fold hydrolase n=1 Tax=Pseudonocardia pini TaxID=2758030 RepID=UPI0015F0F82B|nr:alpha/beta hydrolase [Pseudonocardia pini]
MAGRRVPITTSGTGPNMVLVHGGGVGPADYRRTIARLSTRLTVHHYNRYTEPPGVYDLDADVALLREVLALTGARRVLGHSVGGFLVLHAAAQGLPLERIALYDAAVSIDGSFPSWYLDDFEAAVAAGDLPTAFALVGRGLRHTPGPALPMPVGKVVGALFARTPIGRRMGERFTTVVGEARAATDHDGPASAYVPIEAEVLLAFGGAGPAHYGESARALAAALPNARAVAMPRARHDWLNRAGAAFMQPFEDFLAG